jgi:hypothetical protein
MEWGWTAWTISVVAVVASGAVAHAGGLWRRRPGLEMGFVNHGGMWGDLVLLPVANAAIVPHVRPGWWLAGALAGSMLASIGLHRWWHGGETASVRDHMWPSRGRGHWARDLSPAGWCHVGYVAGELIVIFAYALAPMPGSVVLVVTLLLTLHVPIGLLQPAWFATGRVMRWNVQTVVVALAVVWAIAAAKISAIP